MRVRRWSVLFIVPAAIGGGCREQLTVCESLNCSSSAPGEGGAAGASAQPPDLSLAGDPASGGVAELGSGGSAVAGEGGKPDIETCAERAQTCPAASVCSETADGAICSYPPDLGMVAYVGNDINGGASLVAVPLSQTPPVRLDWSADAEDGKFVMPWRPLWAPNGQALAFFLGAADFLSDFSQRFYWIDLSRAAPLTPMRIPNIPVNDGFSLTLWSPDSRRFLVQQQASAFVVDFAGGRATTQRVGEEGSSLSELAFCADGEVVYNQDGTAVIAPAEQGQVPTRFEQAVVSVSPGGRWLLLSDGTTDYIAACAVGATARSLQPASVRADWSPDGKHLALSDGYDEPVTRSLWRFERDDAPRLLRQVSSSADELMWQPAGSRLLYRAWQNDAAGTFDVLDLTAEPSDRALPIAPELIGDDSGFDLSWVAQSSKVRWSYFDEEAELHELLLDLATDDAAVVTLGARAPDWFSSDGEQTLSIDEEAGGSQLWLSRVSAPAERQPLFPEPLPCRLLVIEGLPGGPPLLECNDADDRVTLYAVAADLQSALKLSDGTYVDDPALRPIP